MSNTRITPQQAAGMMGELQSEVSAEAAPLLQFISRHAGIIVGVILLLIVAIVALGVYQWRSEGATREASLALGKALTSTTGEAKVQALEAMRKDVPESMREGLLLEIAMAALDAEQLDKAAATFGEVAKYDTGPMGFAAAMNQSDILLRAGKADEALKVLENLERTVPNAMRAALLQAIAAAAEEAGNAGSAIKAYEGLLGLGETDMDNYFRARIEVLRSASASKNAG